MKGTELKVESQAPGSLSGSLKATDGQLGYLCSGGYPCGPSQGPPLTVVPKQHTCAPCPGERQTWGSRPLEEHLDYQVSPLGQCA